MAVAGISVRLDAAELRGLIEQVQKFMPPKQAAQILAAVVRKAIRPTVNTLRRITPVGPTENLKRAVTSKVVQYGGQGVAVGIVGYTRAGSGAAVSAAGGTVRAGKDRAFHQWWLEAGTDDRVFARYHNKPYQRTSPTKPFTRTRLGRQEVVRGRGVVHTVSGQNAYIASSFNRLGPFRMLPSSGGGRVQTDPAYPRAFFKKSSQPFTIRGVTPGGTMGKPPLRTAWEQTQGDVASTLAQLLSVSIGQAWAALRFRESGVVNSTDTL
jgi:hypothetical protein